MNSKNEILVASSYGGIQLVGGHVEDEEDILNALKREIKEEAGIEVSSNEISKPFFEIKHYMKNYYNSSKNVIAKMLYYIVKTDKEPDINLMKRTEREEECDFNIRFVSCDSFEKMVKECSINNEKEINRVIAAEMLTAFDELKTTINS